MQTVIRLAEDNRPSLSNTIGGVSDAVAPQRFGNTAPAVLESPPTPSVKQSLRAKVLSWITPTV